MNTEPDKLKPMGTQSKETLDLAAAKARDAVGLSRMSTDEALDHVTDKVDKVKARATTLFDKAGDMASSVADEAKDQVHNVKEKVRVQATYVSDKVADYTQDDPLKAMLIAAATGALLMGLLSMMVRSRD